MKYGLIDGVRAVASSGATARCPGCGAPLVAKCGSIVVHHWAHASGKDCDPWWEPEGEWHRWWKDGVPADRVEVVIGTHRADIVTCRGMVVELQHSGIDERTIAEREWFYQTAARGIVWLFDARKFCENVCMRPKRDHITFRWKWPRKSLFAVRAPMFWDLGDGRIIHVQKVHPEVPCGGWGYIRNRDWFRRFITREESA